jgi:hypothetical protein
MRFVPLTDQLSEVLLQAVAHIALKKSQVVGNRVIDPVTERCFKLDQQLFRVWRSWRGGCRSDPLTVSNNLSDRPQRFKGGQFLSSPGLCFVADSDQFR